MTIDEFRHALGCLIADSEPLPIGDVLDALKDECKALHDEERRMRKRNMSYHP